MNRAETSDNSDSDSFFDELDDLLDSDYDYDSSDEEEEVAEWISNTSLTKLDLSVITTRGTTLSYFHQNNEIGDEGAKDIGKALKTNTLLTQLSLSLT